MKGKKQTSIQEKRKAQDSWFYAKGLFALSAWLLFLFALVMSYYAAPESNYGIVKYYNIDVRQFWLTPLTGYLYILLWLSAFACYVSLLIGRYRNRRRADNPEYHLIFLLTVNLIWLFYILSQLNIF